MNRERDLRGSNGYEVEVGFDPLEWLQGRLVRQSNVRWLDLCCGSGKAMIQAAIASEKNGGGLTWATSSMVPLEVRWQAAIDRLLATTG